MPGKPFEAAPFSVKTPGRRDRDKEKSWKSGAVCSRIKAALAGKVSA